MKGSPIRRARWVDVDLYAGQQHEDGTFTVEAKTTAHDFLVEYGSGAVAVMVQWDVPDVLPWHDGPHATDGQAPGIPRRASLS